MAVLLPTTSSLPKPLKQKSNGPHFTSPVLPDVPVRLSSFIPTPTRESLASNHHVPVVVIAATALPDPRMRIVGLTGGISSGKSTVSNLFKASDIPVVDADVVARDVLKKGTGGWKKVVKAFGEEILLDNGEVDRPKLGSIVFSDPTKRQLLNRILAPYISSGILKEVLKLWLKGYKVIVLDVPLLFEAKLDKWTNPVIVVWVDHETQLQRLKARDGISDEEARNKINAQMSLDSKRSKADIVIDNNGSREDLNIQFQDVSRVVNRPLTWGEFMRSRQGAFSAVVLCVTGLIFSRKM